jgi:hypothetical protein
MGPAWLGATITDRAAMIGLVAKNKPSGNFCGYWQRSNIV